MGGGGVWIGGSGVRCPAWTRSCTNSCGLRRAATVCSSYCRLFQSESRWSESRAGKEHLVVITVQAIVFPWNYSVPSARHRLNKSVSLQTNTPKFLIDFFFFNITKLEKDFLYYKLLTQSQLEALPRAKQPPDWLRAGLLEGAGRRLLPTSGCRPPVQQLLPPGS